jgi:hypothetical protein
VRLGGRVCCICRHISRELAQEAEALVETLELLLAIGGKETFHLRIHTDAPTQHHLRQPGRLLKQGQHLRQPSVQIGAEIREMRHLR